MQSAAQIAPLELTRLVTAFDDTIGAADAHSPHRVELRPPTSQLALLYLRSPMVNTHDIITILRSDPIWKINFSYRGQSFFASDYFGLASSIDRGTVSVVVDDSVIDGGFDAMYFHTRSETPGEGSTGARIRNADTLYLRRRFDRDRILSRALLVHEATHAIQDRRAIARGPWRMSRLDAEAGAYVAQAMYFLACQTSWSEEARRERSALGRPLDNPRVDLLISAAHQPAQRIFTTSLAHQVTEAEQRRLRSAIGAHPAYAGRQREVVPFDGWERERGSVGSGG